MSKLQPKVGTKKLGIRFGDNDFGTTIKSFLRVLLPNDHTGHRALDMTFTKARVVELFNGMAYSLYILKQNAWRYESGPNIKKYLRITEKNVLLDDEVDQHIAEWPNDNGEFHAVDFTENYVWSC